jgi:hypothetical protein
MTAATQKRTLTAKDIEKLADELRRATYALEHAADDAAAAADDVRAAVRGEIDEDGWKKTSLELADAIVRLHEDTHDGPIMWCPHHVCRKADGLASIETFS